MDLSKLSWNDLVDLREAVDARMLEQARDLRGKTVKVPAHLLAPDTPVERHTATVTRINPRRKAGGVSVSIEPGGAYGGASLSLHHIRLA